jgi:hypothetical protein
LEYFDVLIISFNRKEKAMLQPDLRKRKPICEQIMNNPRGELLSGVLALVEALIIRPLVLDEIFIYEIGGGANALA